MTTPNPELMLACAKKAYQEYEWELINGMLFRSINPEAVQRKSGYFDPITNPADAHALMLALLNRGNGWWSFCKTIEAEYQATSAESNTILRDLSFPALLLKCVSAETNIPLGAP